MTPVSALLLLLPALAASATAPATPVNEVTVSVEATLGSDGSLDGTLRTTYKGGCAAEIRSRLKTMKTAERQRALASVGGDSLSSRLEPSSTLEGLDGSGDVTVSYRLHAPRYAGGAGGPLSVTLPLIAPYDPGKLPASMVPLSIVHDFAIKLPPAMAPLEFPSAFSSVTPDAGRYVLYFDAVHDGKGDALTLTARRELMIDGADPAKRSELLSGVALHDTTSISIVPVKAKPRPG